MKLKSNTIEAIGLALLLFSFGWQLFEEKVVDISVNSELYYLHSKLDGLWDLNKTFYLQEHPQSSGFSPTVDVGIMDDNWSTYSGMKRELSGLNTQIANFKLVRIAIFVLGSLMMIYAKVKE